jgi:hypothetical protein
MENFTGKKFIYVSIKYSINSDKINRKNKYITLGCVLLNKIQKKFLIEEINLFE